jgi:hypothetical protein
MVLQANGVQLNAQGKVRTPDPQWKIPTVVKTTASNGELIVFSIHFGFFEFVVLVPIPDDGMTTGVAYVKSKMARPRFNRDRDDNLQNTQSRYDRDEVRDDRRNDYAMPTDYDTDEPNAG